MKTIRFKHGKKGDRPRLRPVWTSEEDQFLRCPIPATYLACGALSSRGAESVRWRRRLLGIYSDHYWGPFVTITGKNPGRRRTCLEDHPGVDWTLSVDALTTITGLGDGTVRQLRREAPRTGGPQKPHRVGRRGYSYTDFPDVDWTARVVEIMAEAGVSSPIAYRLRAEWKADDNDKSRNPEGDA
tara:strand:- start:337 stop:891 length:555 start_codon:yes stop_codon:yes gene_type:complete